MGGQNLTEQYYRYNNPFVSLREHFSLKARSKMYKRFVDICCPQVTDKILDLGATPDVKLKDSNFLEKMYTHPENITICSIEDCTNVAKAYGCGFVFNKPKERLPFEDKQFDILFCSATLEHVGTRDDQIFFLNECLRVAKKVFLTTPNRYFPVEMHTFIPLLHWLPWSVFQRIVGKLVGPFYADINNLNLLSTKDILGMNKELVEAVRVQPVYTLGFKSNLLITVQKDEIN